LAKSDYGTLGEFLIIQAKVERGGDHRGRTGGEGAELSILEIGRAASVSS